MTSPVIATFLLTAIPVSADTIETVIALDTVTQAPLSVLLRMLRGVVRSSAWESEHSA